LFLFAAKKAATGAISVAGGKMSATRHPFIDRGQPMFPARSFCLAALLALSSLFVPALADNVPDEVRSLIEARLQNDLGGETALAITSTPIQGIYQVRLEGGRFLYASADGSHMIAGEMYRFGGEELVNLTDRERANLRQQGLRALDVKDAIVFAPTGKPKAILNVFTDVDCGYCRLFHQQVPALVSKGVEVRYLAFPRSGPDTLDYAKMVTA